MANTATVKPLLGLLMDRISFGRLGRRRPFILLSEAGMEPRLISAEKIISALRQRKTVGEIASMKEAIRLTLEIYDAVGAYMRPGMTEEAIAGFMKERVREAGVGLAWDDSTCPSVFTGPDTAGAHYGPTGRKVERGHILNMDFGLRVDGYCSDLQRTWYVRSQQESTAPPEGMRGFDTIRRSIEEARKAMRPGVQGVQVDAVARQPGQYLAAIGAVEGPGLGRGWHGE